MDRRGFFKQVGTSAAVVMVAPSLIDSVLKADNGTMYQTFERVQLLKEDGTPLKQSDLEKEKNYLFFYPFVSTPCFLLNLPVSAKNKVSLTAENGTKYEWEGGIGENNTLVSYSAICTHQLTYPNKDGSFIRYVKAAETDMAADRRSRIYCNSHKSVYDPAKGAVNISGDAKQPLASVVLEIGTDGEIFAVGVLGPEKFKAFFEAMRLDLKIAYGSPRKAKKKTKVTAKIVTLENYSDDIIGME
jgi:arsenite oxidase small subunit